jgi:pimeloyl-ACP methyl ester carboxylesterase
MPLIIKWMLRALLLMAALLLLLWVYFRFFFHFGPSASELARRMEQAPYPVSSKFYVSGGDTMHYMEGGRPDRGTLVLVHGSPGNWEAWERYMRDSLLCAEARVVAIDRLGYGKSSPGLPVPDLGRQASSLRPLLDSLKRQGPVVLAGHSMGGPIAARAAMDFPELLDGLLILAGSADPALEKVMGAQYLAERPAFRWLLPPDLDVSNRELMPHGPELAAMEARWAGLRVPTTILQGKRDHFVPWQNADYMARLMTARPPKLIYLPEEDHFIAWTQQDLVRQEALALLAGR